MCINFCTFFSPRRLCSNTCLTDRKLRQGELRDLVQSHMEISSSAKALQASGVSPISVSWWSPLLLLRSWPTPPTVMYEVLRQTETAQCKTSVFDKPLGTPTLARRASLHPFQMAGKAMARVFQCRVAGRERHSWQLPSSQVTLMSVHQALLSAEPLFLGKLGRGCEWEGVPLFSSMFVNKENVFLL